MSFFLRILRVFSLVAVCCSAAFADMHPSRLALLTDNAGVTPDLAAVPERQTSERAAPQFTAEPQASPVQPSDVPAKWRELQSRILEDEKQISACRQNESLCSDAARQFLSIVELGKTHEGRAQVGLINRAINMSIRPASDWAQYGYADYWASPLQTLNSGAGDCEDYAIVKYVAFRQLGFDAGDLRLVIVHDDKHEADHAIVAVRSEQQWLILDNRTMAILKAEDVGHYHPLFALDQQGVRKITTSASNRVIINR